MSEYLERTLASKPTFGDYVTLEMKCYGVPNEHFIHEVLSSPFISTSWRNVPIDARDPEEHPHDTRETVIAVRTQGINSRDAQIFAVRLADVLPMKGDKWAWQESPLRTRIAELEEENDRLQAAWFVEETICPDGSLKPKVSALLSRIAELERDKKALRGIEENLREHIDIGTLQLSVATARIAELKAYIDQLIEIGSWAITGMTITTSYSPGVLQDLAEKKSDDWYALIKNLEECDKENERER